VPPISESSQSPTKSAGEQLSPLMSFSITFKVTFGAVFFSHDIYLTVSPVVFAKSCCERPLSSLIAFTFLATRFPRTIKPPTFNSMGS